MRTELLELPAAPGAKSLLLAVGSAGDVALYAAAAGDAPIAATAAISGDDRVTAVFFTASLEELQLDRGWQDFDPAIPRSRYLPAERTIFLRRDATWLETDELPPELSFEVLPKIDAVRCAGALGCFRGADRTICKLPCDSGPPPEPTHLAALPTPPQPPVLTIDGACPPRWTIALREDDQVTICEPPAAVHRASCSGDQAQLIDDLDCRPIGEACDPLDDYAKSLPAETIFVRAGAPFGGNGTRAAPYATIAAALAAAPEGGTIALAKGRYDESPRIVRPVTIRGACVAETSIAALDPIDDVVVFATATSTIANLRFDGFGTGVRGHGLGTRVTVEDAIFSRPKHGQSIYSSGAQAVENATVVLRRVVISERREAGITAFCGGTLELDRVLIEKIAGEGINVSSEGDGVCTDGPARLVARDTIVRDSVDFAYRTASGIAGSVAAAIDLRRVLIERVQGQAISLVGPGVTGAIADTIVRDVRPDQNGAGWAAVVSLGGRARFDRFSAEHLEAGGIIVTQAATATIADAVVLDTKNQTVPEDGGSLAILFQLAVGRMERVFVAGAGTVGVAINACSDVIARDVTVRDIAGEALDMHSEGFSITQASVAHLERALVVNAASLGVGVETSPPLIDPCPRVLTEARLDDVDVIAPTDGAFDRFTWGMIVNNATVSTNRVRVMGGRARGIEVSGSSVVFRDTTIGGVAASVDGAFGLSVVRGVTTQHLDSNVLAERLAISGGEGPAIRIEKENRLNITDLEVTRSMRAAIMSGDGSTVTVRRGRFEDARGSVVLTTQEGTVDLFDVDVDGVASCAPECDAVGIDARDSSRVTLTGFRIAGVAEGSGIRVRDFGRVACLTGVIEDNRTAVTLTGEQQGLDEFLESVVFRGNEELYEGP